MGFHAIKGQNNEFVLKILYRSPAERERQRLLIATTAAKRDAKLRGNVKVGGAVVISCT